MTHHVFVTGDAQVSAALAEVSQQPKLHELPPVHETSVRWGHTSSSPRGMNFVSAASFLNVLLDVLALSSSSCMNNQTTGKHGS